MSRTVIIKARKEPHVMGYSHYLLIDSTMKEILSQSLGEPFDKEKHDIVLEVSSNKSGQKFVAFWFDKKK